MNQRTLTYLGIIALIAVFAISPAYAGGLDGGLNEVKSNMETVKKWIMSLAGIAAVIYILWKALETWRGRGDWGEFAISVGYVALAGGAAAIANWAWGLFGG